MEPLLWIVTIISSILSLGATVYSVVLVIKMIRYRKNSVHQDIHNIQRSFIPYGVVNLLALLYLGIVFLSPTTPLENFPVFGLIILLIVGFAFHFVIFNLHGYLSGDNKQCILVYFSQ